MKRMITLVTFLSMLICGCGSGHYWYKYGATLEETEAACKQCSLDSISEIAVAEHIAKQDAQVTKTPYIPESQQTEEIVFSNCMKAKGYRVVSGDSLNPSLRKKYGHPTSKGHFSIAGK